MSFISKIMDILKLESTRKMENTADNAEKEAELSVLEAYAEIDRANKITEIVVKESQSEPIKEEIEIPKGNNLLTTETAIEEPKQELREENLVPIEEKLKPPEDKLKPEPFKYIFPPVSLLDKMEDSENYIGKTEEQAEKLKQTFEAFGVNADIVEISHGARFTRFEIQIGKGVRVRDVLKIEDDIKLNLEAANLHIEAPIPGRTTIGIDVENKELPIVTFREMIESKEFMENPSDLAVTVGKDVVGNTIIESLDNMCHLLIGGTTGSGKSVCISSLIMSILYKADPNNVKLLMIDTKAVNLTMYNGIPHLLIPVVTDLRKSTGALQWGAAEMTDRYRKFAEFGVKDLKGYNKAVEKYSSSDEPPQKMPQIVIIIDDFSDLMIAYSGSTEENICRLAQMGRTAGIHLVISTQRPSVEVITGIIKANISSRIAFNVFSAIDSRTILDAKGAEDLLSDGDMLFYPQGARTPLRVQGTYVSDREMESVINFVKSQMVGYYGVDYEKKSERVQSACNKSELAPYFIEAGKFIIEKDKASIGMIQRIFKIGFNRAVRIMDQLEEAGVVGEEEGVKPRMVLMSLDMFEEYIKELHSVDEVTVK
ncbi:MAG: hypothetical protein HFG96_03870 [Lachnospiraceae bacterium]|jgi:S-DNA-T family DNA segregation ATPase FtsK/SpoIIIE|nr:hypothetical protein [Lachnospiraceae bacterium]